MYAESPSPNASSDQSKARTRPTLRQTRSDYYLELNPFEEAFKAPSASSNVPTSSPHYLDTAPTFLGGFPPSSGTVSFHAAVNASNGGWAAPSGPNIISNGLFLLSQAHQELAKREEAQMRSADLRAIGSQSSNHASMAANGLFLLSQAHQELTKREEARMHSVDLGTPVFQDLTASKTTLISPPKAREAPPSSTFDAEAHDRFRAASFEQSARMFEQAHNIIIGGGEFYNAAGNMNIDNSRSVDASIHPANVTHLWQYQHTSNQIVMRASIGDEPAGQIVGKQNDSGAGRRCLGEDGTSNKAEVTENDRNHSLPSSSLELGCPHSVIECLSVLNKFELANQYEQPNQDVVITYPAISSADENLTDQFVHDILSNYPSRPIGNSRLFERIVKALLFSFSPLHPSMIAALFNLGDAQHVTRILRPAYPLIFVPRVEDKREENGDRTPVRFIHPSIIEFFLDWTRSGKYFVDTPTAHRVLLEVSTSVMRRVHEEGRRLDSMSPGWQDAYEYACQNWETHRRAGNRSKL